MYLFLIPLILEFALNGASAFTAAYSQRWGERGGQLATLILREELDLVQRLPAYREYMEQVPPGSCLAFDGGNDERYRFILRQIHQWIGGKNLLSLYLNCLSL